MLDYIQQHPVISVLVFIGCLLLLFIGVRLVFALVGALRNRAAAQDLKKDLTLWKNLSALVRGGNKQDQAKADLSARVEMLRQRFKDGLNAVKKARLISKQTPWYLLLGEPLSGKTSLLNAVGYNFEKTAGSSSDSKSPLNFFFNPQAVILDVDGKVFFDRWLSGASAEWSELLNLLFKKHGNLPVTGIIITIPADALLADDEELTRRKAALMAESLHDFSRVSQRTVPVYVLVTKLDTVTGFAEFFNSCSGEDLKRIFGYVNSSDGYERDAVLKYFAASDAVLAGILNQSLLQAFESSDSRMQQAAPAFLFPVEFKKLAGPLAVYTDALFSTAEYLQARYVKLQGIFFLASFSRGVGINQAFAAIQQAAADAVVIRSEAGASKHAYFCHDLFYKLIFKNSVRPVFSRRLLFKRRLPALLATTALSVLSLYFIGGAALETSGFAQQQKVRAGFIRQVGDLFKTETVDMLPLVAARDGGRFDAYDELLPESTTITRIDYYWSLINQLYASNYPPAGLWLSAWLQNGLSADLKWEDRRFIANELQAYMAYLPAVHTFEQQLIASEDEPMTRPKAEALKELLNISLYNAPVARTDNAMYSKNTLGTFLDYLLPEANKNVLSILTVFDPKRDRLSAVTNAMLVLSPDHSRAARAGLNSWYSGYEQVTNYPDSNFQINCAAIEDGARLGRIYDEMKQLCADEAVPDASSAIRYRALARQALESIAAIDDNGSALLSKMAPDKSGQDDNKEADPEELVDWLELSYRDYLQQFNQDVDFISSYGRHQSRLQEASGSLYLDNELYERFSRQRNKLQEAIDRHYDQARTERDYLIKEELFTRLQDSDGRADRFYYNVLGRVLQLSLYAENRETFDSPLDFATIWDREQQRAAKAREQLQAYLKDSGAVSSFGPAAAAMLDRQVELEGMKLVSQLLSFYPSSRSELGSISRLNRDISSESSAADALKAGFPADIVRDVLGNYDFYFGEYDPAAAQRFLAPFAALKKALGNKEKPLSENFVRNVSQDERFIKVDRLIAQYCSEFMQFWSYYVNSLGPAADSWKEFHAYVSRVRAYQINSVLLDLYDTSYRAINGIDAVLLDEKLVQERSAALASLLNKQKILSMTFSSASSKLLSAWASLSPNAVLANNHVMKLSKEQLRSGLRLLPDDENAETAIPFYAKLINLGTNLLKLESHRYTNASLRRYHTEFMHFPMISDASARDQTLSRRQLESFKALLLTLNPARRDDAGTDLAALGAAEETETDPLQQNTFSSSGAMAEWAADCLDVIDLIAGKEALTYTLSIPSLPEQTALLKAAGITQPSALSRMRYVNIKSGAVQDDHRYATFRKDSKVPGGISFKTGIEDGGLTFTFYQYTDDEEPDCIYVLQGDYAALRAYFKPDSIYDKTSGSLAVPLYLTDSKGVDSCLFITLSFSRPLIPLSGWPSAASWPAL